MFSCNMPVRCLRAATVVIFLASTVHAQSQSRSLQEATLKGDKSIHTPIGDIELVLRHRAEACRFIEGKDVEWSATAPRGLDY